MPKNCLRLKSRFIFLLIFGVFTQLCDSWTDINGADDGRDGRGNDRNAFFAMQSCHQVLRGGDRGEFFSPDYLCSSPPLWCNWTIVVAPGKRVRLYLEDLAPEDACLLKQDQIHVDEPAGYFAGHKVLQRCWREAEYISLSNTLYVVLLIAGYPDPPYRGFYGRYQAFGPPVAYSPPRDDVTERGRKPRVEHEVTQQPVGQRFSFTRFTPTIDTSPQKTVLSEHPTFLPEADYEGMYDDDDQAELPGEAEEEQTETDDGTLKSSPIIRGQEDSSPQVNDSDVFRFTVMPNMAMSTQGIYRAGRGASHTVTQQQPTTDEGRHPLSSSRQHTPSATLRDVDDVQTQADTPLVAENDSTPGPTEVTTAATVGGLEQVGEDENSIQQLIKVSRDVEETRTHPHPHPNMVEPRLGHRRHGNDRNHTGHIPHLPGDLLFEVTVEVSFQHDPAEAWEDVATSLLMSVLDLISTRLVLHNPISTSSKRTIRLDAGVLYILWLQTGEAPARHRALPASLEGLRHTVISLGDSERQAVIVSMSTKDVNECGTQLVLCDINAECVNHFATYACHCRPGFKDLSHLGSGGTHCVDVKASACSSGPSAEMTNGVYVMFFLLSALILITLLVVAAMCHRHHTGAFIFTNGPHIADGSLPDPCSDNLPPPPPPIRRPKDGWSHPEDCCPAVDPHLVRFSPLLPLDSYIDPVAEAKM